MAEHPPQPVIPYGAPPEPKPSGSGCLRRGLIAAVIFIGLAFLLLVLLSQRHVDRSEISLSDFAEKLDGGNVAEMIVESNTLRGTLKTGAQKTFRVRLNDGMGSNWGFIEWLLANRNGATVRLDNDQNLVVSLLVPLIPWLLIFGFIWFFVFRGLRKAQSAPPKPIPVYIVQPENP